jgi:hypothetical protein
VDGLETGNGKPTTKDQRRETKDEKLAARLDQLPTTIAGLSHHYPGLALRDYQLEPAETIAQSISEGGGGQFALAFSRQSGKDELLAQLLAWLLITYAERGGNAVIAAPSKSPQADMSRDRLVARLREVVPELVQVKQGYIVEVGKASARFLSASPVANVRGQTADLLLVANEAQGIDPDIWDPVFDPMAASTNATTLFMGTVWTRETLLARQMRHLESLQARDGRTRVWKVRWEKVAALVPAYGDRVAAALAQFGEDHPFIRTEYCLEELDGEQGFFPPHRMAAMRGDHVRRHAAEPGSRYLLLLDVAGEEEHGGTAEAFASTGRRDSTALTVVEIDERHGRRPIFRVVDRRSWTGVKHPALRDELVHLARQVWRAERVVIDATGIGAGLASFLEAELTDRRLGRPITVQRFIFSSASKSQLGWDLIGLIDTGRYREYRDEAPVGSPERRVTEQFWAELKGITYEVQPGQHKLMRWGALHGKGHDDLVMSAALIAAVDSESVRRRVAMGSRS